MNPADDTDRKGPLFLRHFVQSRQGIFAFIMALVPNRSDAEDLFQEASAVMWDKFDPADPPRDFRAWGCKIAYYKVLDFRKKQARSKLSINQAMFEAVASSLIDDPDSLACDDLQLALDHCLQQISAEDRELLAQRYQEGATTKSTAASAGRSVDAVYKALSRLRSSLFDCISSRMGRA